MTKNNTPAEVIENPTWNDVREGDVITVTKGEEDALGYIYTIEVTPNLVETFQKDGWIVTKIVREVPNSLPVPAKELRELLEYLETREYIPAELTNFVTATRREWERAGINEKDH